MPAGRPSKLTAETREKLLRAIRAGNYLDVAAAYAGISKSTLHSWLKQGRETEVGDYAELVEAIDEALATAEVRDVSIIAKAAEKQWQAAAWRLERRAPDRWARRTPDHDVTAELMRVELEKRHMENELLRAELAKLKAQQIEGEATNAPVQVLLGELTDADVLQPPETTDED